MYVCICVLLFTRPVFHCEIAGKLFVEMRWQAKNANKNTHADDLKLVDNNSSEFDQRPIPMSYRVPWLLHAYELCFEVDFEGFLSFFCH